MSAQVLDPPVGAATDVTGHPLYPVAACVQRIADALDDLPDGPVPSVDPEALEVLVEETTRQRRQLAELGLRLARAAEQSRAEVVSGASDTGAWLARLTGTSAAVQRGGLWLARMLDERYPAVRTAFAAGDLGEDHARIIVRAAEQMPTAVTEQERDTAVQALVCAAVERRLNTKALRRRARRMLEVVDRTYADRHEAALVQGEEERADVATWFFLGDNGDGTWTGKFVVPDLHAGLLLTLLEHLSSPRRVSTNRAGERVVDPTIADRTCAWGGLSQGDRLGQAFLELCEHLPTDGLAQHGRVGATIAVHIDHQHLVDGLGAAHLDTGADLSAGQARRLACEAGIMPIVYNGASVTLDAGRIARLHNKAQRLVLSGMHDACAAEGCQRPFAWCEIHHPTAWARGGRTDLTGIPLCGWHHRRAHDDLYRTKALPTGEIRFHRRR
ncbi:MAG: DUF222 domain-containing protein [Marmoricola sp.]|nr:DUF222 domain-containing protein [Marmoricola sp.]